MLIVYVERLRVSVTYSDIHRRRLEFFERRLKDFSWTVSNRHASDMEEDIFYLATGVYDASDMAGLDAALEKLGASVVFLIDWNKARKSLCRLVSKSAATSILDWAADRELGHRAYLEIGGDAVVGDLLETASKATGGFYTSLQSALSEDGAVEFLREVLRIASEELRRGRSALAIRDQLRAELLARVASIADRIIDVAIDHAALMLDLGNLVRGVLLEGRAASDRVVARANAWEALADRQVTRIRDMCGSGSERTWRDIASGADDAADDFEETAFRLQFLPEELPADIREGLLRLAEYAVAAVKDYVRMLCALRALRKGVARRDMRKFLEFVEKLHDQEHATDEAEREVFSRLMRADVDAKTLNIVTAVADGLENPRTLCSVRAGSFPIMLWESGLQPDAIQIIEPGGLEPADDALMAVGGKAFNLLKLAAVGFPVPPGFVLPTSMCAGWIAAGPPSQEDFRTLVGGPLDRLERAAGASFGDTRRPLLVSVRSGAPVSMPGMLDTVLDIGLTRANISGLIAQSGNPRMAWDCYLRLMKSYATTVHGLHPATFNEAGAKIMAAAGAATLAELDTLTLRDLVQHYLDVFEDEAGEAFPEDPHEQLRQAVNAVFRSWNSERAKSYRRINGLDGLSGTAVTVQRMVYGNAGPRSGAGVGFTRDPATGEKRLYLDFAFDAQGEDVVSGRRRLTSAGELVRALPEVSRSLEHVATELEQVFRDAQDFEFTVEEGELFLLQTRDAKRSAWARLKIAVDLVREDSSTRRKPCAALPDLIFPR